MKKTMNQNLVLVVIIVVLISAAMAYSQNNPPYADYIIINETQEINNSIDFQLNELKIKCAENQTCFDNGIMQIYSSSVRGPAADIKISNLTKCYKNYENVIIFYATINKESQVGGFFTFWNNTPYIVLGNDLLNHQMNAPSYYHEMCHYEQWKNNEPYSEPPCYYVSHDTFEKNTPMPQMQEVNCNDYKYMLIAHRYLDE